MKSTCAPTRQGGAERKPRTPVLEGGLRWECEAGRFPSPETDLPELLAEDGETRRTLPGREVSRVESRRIGTVAVKRYRPRRWVDWFRFLLLPSPARREWELAREAREAGVHFARPVALAERRRRGFLLESVLVLDWVDGFPLGEWFEALPAGDSRRRRLFEALGGFLRDLHDRGVVHGDLHPGNLVLKTDGPPFDFVLLDAGSMKIKSHVGPRDRVAGLVQLDLYFFRRSSRAERARLLKRYLGPETARQERKRWGRDVESATEQAARRLWRKMSRRCVGDNKYFARYRAGGSRGFIRAGSPWPRAGDDPNRPFLKGESRTLKDSAGALSVLFESEGVSVYGKRFRPRTFWEAMKSAVRPAKALKTWKKAWALEVRGIPTPKPFMAAWGKWPRWGSSVYFSEGRSRGLCLDRFLHEGGEAAGPAVLSALGDLIGTMHRFGFSHRDLKAGNLLIEPGAPPAVWLTDLDGLRDAGRVSVTRKRKDLLRLRRSLFEDCGATPADWETFERRYRFASGIAPALSPHSAATENPAP